MTWTIKFYESKNGDKPVEEFIKTCEPLTIAKISHHIDLLERHGHFLGMPHSKKLSHDIYELRIRGKQEIRITYMLYKHNIYLLHAFKKQKQKTPRKEIEVSLKRMGEIKMALD